MDTKEDAILKRVLVGQRSVSFLLEREVRGLMARVLKGCKKSRKQVADELTALTRLKVSERMLNDWCSPSRRGLRIPLSLVRAFCEVTESDDLAFMAMSDDLRERAELGARAIE